jgi:GTPase SAR1 family protein
MSRVIAIEITCSDHPYHNVFPLSANNFADDACCAILHVILNIRSLEHVDMGNGLSDNVDYYVSSTSWRTANLVQPPPEVVAGGWDRVIAFLRAGPCLPIHELRLMLIGHGEVGKTSLIESFAAPNYMAARISKVDRTVGIVRKPLVLNSRSGPEITCEVCDCAGQEIYHLSHTLYFTRRCLYLLMWSPHKFADDGTAQVLSEDEIIGPLKRWLQLLAANIPEATVMIVGTHSQIDPEVFQSMRTRVDFHVKEEIHRLHVTAKNEADKTGQIIQQQEVKFKEICDEIDVALSKHNLKHGTLLALPKYENYLMHHNLQGHEKFVNFLLALQPQLNRSLRLKTQELRDFMQVMTETRLRLCKLYAKHGSSVISPKDAADLAKLTFVNEHSFAVDSVDGVGIETLLHAIEATCRDPTALPFLSEPVPVYWFQVKEALMQRTLSYDIGDCVLPLEDAAVRIRNALKNRDNFGERVPDDVSGDLDDENWETCSSDGGDSDKNNSSTDTPCAAGSALPPSLHNPEEDEEEDGWETCDDEDEDTMIQELDVQKSLEFWSLLGRVFVYNGYFLRDPWHVMTLMKPLVHHHVISMKFCEEYCVGSFDAMKECLVQLHQRSLLDHRLLSHFNHWAELSLEARQSMLMFFKECFIISDLYRGSASHGDVSLVTARLCNPGDTDIQDRIAAEAADIERESEHYAVYAISSAHIGLIARMQAAIAPFVQPCRIDLRCGKDHICMSRFSRLKCSVSVRRLEEVFESNMHSLSEMVSIDEFSHGFIICSNDCGLFAFAVQFVDKIIQTCVFGSLYQIWLPLPCRPGAAWQPMSTDWVQLRTTDIPKSLFEILSANVGDVVSPSRNLRLKDISPRKSPIFMSRTCSGDGTGEICQRIKDALQEKLLCTVWFDKREIDWMGVSVDEMQMGIRDACVFVICLTPLYLTRPHCLRQLRWILDMCTSAGSMKKKRILVLPLHPAVSVEGCRKIIKAAETQRPAHVFLRVDDRVNVPPGRLDELKGHRLSDDAILLLKRLINQCCESFQLDWVKLQPWLSDKLGADWEEVSSVWAEQKHVSIDELLGASVPDMLNLIAAPSETIELGFTGLDHQNLVADPPSQEFFSPGNVDIICECYPNSRSVLSEQELVAVVQLGLHDEDIMSCIEHGCGELSVSEELGAADMVSVNPINVVSRIAAHMSGVNFLGPQIKEARRVTLSDVLSALSTPDFVEMFFLSESPWNFLELMRALARKLLIQPDARVFSKNAVVIMEKYIELFAQACNNHMKSENERVQRERQLEIENMQAAREQREQALVALLEEAEPKKAECLGCNELKFPWVSCSQGHILCGDCFSDCVSAQVARVHAVERLEFLRNREICCSCCKAVGNVFVFDMHKFSHFLSSAVWGQYLSALEAYWIAETEKSLTKRGKDLQAQQQSLQLTLDCHKQQERVSNAVKYIRDNLIIAKCPYREGNTSNKCGAPFLPDFEGCPHIKVRFYRRVKPVSVTNRIPVPEMWQRRVRVVHQ